MKKVWLSWSSGKDSAWALHMLKQNPEFEVAGLVTTVNQQFKRVAMHAVRRELLRSQAASTGLPLHEINLPWPCSNVEYESAMAEFLEKIKADGISRVAYGDLYLEDIREYRESTLAQFGIEAVFPIWGRDTRSLAAEMIAAGLRATVTCVDPKQLSADFAGREFDAGFIEALPDGAETIEVDGGTYYYADWSFWQATAAGGYVAVAPPVGAEVSSIPDESLSEEEGDVVVYQFDELYFTRDTDESGKTIYRVEPQPPEEEIDEIPAGSPSFVADGETYYYVNYNFYVQYEENGKTGYVNGEPEIGAQVDTLPDQVTTVEEEGVTYYQFDSVFFEEVEGDDEQTFYEVVGSPDGSDEEVEN